MPGATIVIARTRMARVMRAVMSRQLNRTAMVARRSTVRSAIGDHKLWIFGHLGDGNLHVIVQVQLKDYLALRPKIEAVVYGPLGKLGGSISAEHGIGLEKKPYLSVCRNDSEIAVMRRLKTALDPAGILNPGKIF